MTDLLINIGLLLSRYLHIVCTTLLVGGTLFFEMVVPVAINDLKQEQQLAVFGRARWMFRGIVWISGLLLILSGVVSSAAHWKSYTQWESPTVQDAPGAAPRVTAPPPAQVRPGWWWAAHASTGALAVLIALSLTSRRRPPDHAIGWMRLNFMILLIVIFLGTATGEVRQFVTSRAGKTPPATKPAAIQPN